MGHRYRCQFWRFFENCHLKVATLRGHYKIWRHGVCLRLDFWGSFFIRNRKKIFKKLPRGGGTVLPPLAPKTELHFGFSIKKERLSEFYECTTRGKWPSESFLAFLVFEIFFFKVEIFAYFCNLKKSYVIKFLRLLQAVQTLKHDFYCYRTL